MSSTITVNNNDFKATTKYSDFAKTANEFFSKEFPSGVVKFEAKTVSKGALASSLSRGLNGDTFTDEFKLCTVKDLASGAIQAEVKNTTGLSLIKDTLHAKATLTINSNNTLSETLVLKNPLYENLKMELSGSLTPSGPANAAVGLEMSHGPVMFTSKCDVFNGPIIKSDLSTRFRDFYFGGELHYDVASANVNQYTASVAFDRPREKAVIQLLTGCKSFNAAYYQRFADNMEVAYKSFWSAKALAMEVGAKYYLVGGGFVKAKLDNAGRMGLSIASDLRPGMQLVLGASIDTNKLADNNHKIGLELSYSA